MARGVGTKPLSLVRGQIDPHRRCEQLDFVNVEGGQADDEASFGIGSETLPPVVCSPPRRDEHDDPIFVEPLHGREQRPGRRTIGPVQVFNHHHDRPVILTPGPAVEDLHARREALVGRGPELASELERSSCSEFVRLGMRSLHARRKMCHDMADERSLPQAGVTLHPYHPGMPRPRLLERTGDGITFSAPTDEQACRSRRVGRDHVQTVAAPTGRYSASAPEALSELLAVRYDATLVAGGCAAASRSSVTRET